MNSEVVGSYSFSRYSLRFDKNVLANKRSAIVYQTNVVFGVLKQSAQQSCWSCLHSVEREICAQPPAVYIRIGNRYFLSRDCNDFTEIILSVLITYAIFERSQTSTSYRNIKYLEPRVEI